MDVKVMSDGSVRRAAGAAKRSRRTSNAVYRLIVERGGSAEARIVDRILQFDLCDAYGARFLEARVSDDGKPSIVVELRCPMKLDLSYPRLHPRRMGQTKDRRYRPIANAGKIFASLWSRLMHRR